MTPPRYRADAPALRRTVVLDEAMTLIFHRPSATTHVVASPVPEILEALAEGAADAATLFDRLAADFDFEAPGSEQVPDLTARLDELVAAGLVSRA